MSRQKSEQHGAQRKLILDNAAEAFAELGFPGASMLHLAARCGVSKSLLYHYYTSKEQLLFDLLEEYMQRLVALTERAAPKSPRARFEALIHSFMQEYETSRQRHRVLLNDLKYLSARERNKIIGYERQVVAAFAAVIGDVLDLPPTASLIKPLTMALFGMMNWTFTWLKPDKGLSYQQFAELLLALFSAGSKHAVKRARGIKMVSMA
ncbi:MAG: TetR/AcrR family transcriptional regulator [Burkholderiales bacterium]